MCKENNKQKEYEKVMAIMKAIANIHPDRWTSKTTNEVIKLVLLRWGVKETIEEMTGDNSIVDKSSRLILIEDLLESFSLNEIMIFLYYTFNIEEYNKLMEGVDPDIVEQKYCELSQRLNVFMISTISKFDIDDDILKILPPMSNIEFKSQDQIRILWFNKLIGIETIVKHGYLYSEEFTDYIIDYIICKSEKIEDENHRNDLLLNIYKLMSERYFIKHSDMFKEKHRDTINKVSQINISRTYGLKNKFN